MTKKEAIKIFEEKKVRTAWDDETEEWYFSIVDVVSILTESVDGRKYWNKLKQRLKEEGNETVTNCHQLKMLSADGKMRFTDVATTEQMFRLIQSIPSPKAEPFKLWMAQTAKERLDEMQDPAKEVLRLEQNKDKSKNNKTDKNHPIKFYLFLKKTNIRHTRTIILKIPAIFLISMNIRKTKILLYYLQQNIFKPQISHLLTEHSDL